MKKIYLDYAATTPLDPAVLDEMMPYMKDFYGNPSSAHLFGQKARAAIDEARRKVARALYAQPDEIIFTGGGTEANNTALFGAAWALKEKGNHIITTAIEHRSVLEPCRELTRRGWHVTYVGVDREGRLDPEAIRRAILDETVLISVMHANNEIGTIQPIGDIAALAQERGVVIHTDAVQTFGHVPVDVGALGVDMATLTAHKLCGPKGVGALYLKRGTPLQALLWGGAQEKRRRAGTENVSGIVGFGKAVEIADVVMESEALKLSQLRNYVMEKLPQAIKHIHFNGHATERLPNNINITFNYCEAEALLMNLDSENIAVSAGSACTSAAVEPSHVLAALGLSEEAARGTLRITMGRWTQQEDMGYLMTMLPPLVERLRSLSPLYQHLKN